MLQAPPTTAAPPARDVWQALADRLNPAYERPCLRAGVVSRGFTSVRGDAYYIARSPAGTYVRLAPEEHSLLALMDGEHQVKDLVLAYFGEHHCFAFQRVVHLVSELRTHCFLREGPRDAWAGLGTQFARRSWVYRVDQLIKSYKYHEFGLNGLDPIFSALYRAGGWLCFTRPAVLLGVTASIVGAVLFLHELLAGQHNPLQVGGSYTLGFLVLLALFLLAVSLHESGHALATKHFGREVPRGGVMLYYGMPAFFTDTTDIWLEPRRARLIVSAAGMAALWGLGGLAMLCVVLWHDSPIAPLAFQFAFVAFVNNSLQLVPLLELDGYYLLMDWLEMPLLRARALAFVREDLWRKLRAREPLDREERILALFGVLALGYSAVALAWAIYLLVHRLQRFALDALAQEAPGLKALVVLAILAFGLPLAFGIVVKLYQALRGLQGGIARWRQRGVTERARVHLDARDLVGRLRFLRELEFGAREALVCQLGRARFPRGAYVLRQGAPAAHFYLIRDGEAEVVQLDADGWPHELAVLRRGDYFGELALLCEQPSAASVRALTPLEVFVLSREAFEAGVAPRLRAHGHGVQRLAERAELARMAAFRHTAPAELEALLERLHDDTFPPGATIVEQGRPNDRFFLIRRGRVQLAQRQADGVADAVAELGPGEHFGDRALLSGDPSEQTVCALEPVTVWTLDRASFLEVVLDQLHLAPALAAEHARREPPRQPITATRAA